MSLLALRRRLRMQELTVRMWPVSVSGHRDRLTAMELFIRLQILDGVYSVSKKLWKIS